MRSRLAALLGALVVAIGTPGCGPDRADPDHARVHVQSAPVEAQSAPVEVGSAPVALAVVDMARPTPWGPDLPSGAVALPGTRPVPVRIRIDALAVDEPIVAAGVTGTGALDLPPDAETLAWFQGGVAPGESGSAVVAGHVDYDGARGALFGLADLSEGAGIEVGFDDGTIRRFVTREGAVSYPKGSLPIDELFRRGGPPVLTLVTCGGRFDPRTRSYADNVTVVAVPAGAGVD